MTPTYPSGSPAVFLDKDGTLLVDVPYNVDPARMMLTPGAGYALMRLGRLGVPLVVVSNQPGVALGYFEERRLRDVANRLAEMFSQHGATLSDFYYCPHAPAASPRHACGCRKPAPGMLQRAADDLDVDLTRSWMIGDILDDVEAGNTAGCRSILIDNGNETEWVQDRPSRIPSYTVRDLVQAVALVASDFTMHNTGGPQRHGVMT